MNNCIFVDALGKARDNIIWWARKHGAAFVGSGLDLKETMRLDFHKMPSRAAIEVACAGAVRAASLADAELDWIIGQPLGEGRIMWTLTQTETHAGDPNAADN